MNTKDRVIDFLKNTKPGGMYVFIHSGDVTEANKMLIRMRTMLSRMRVRAREKKKIIKPLRLETVVIEDYTDAKMFPPSPRCRLTIRWSVGQNDTHGITSDVDALIEKQIHALFAE